MHPAQGQAGQAPAAPAPETAKKASGDIFFETETIIRRLLDSKPVAR